MGICTTPYGRLGTAIWVLLTQSAWAASPGKGDPPTIRLKITVYSTDNSGRATRIQGDNYAPNQTSPPPGTSVYEDGLESVSAVLDRYGNLLFSTGSRRLIYSNYPDSCGAPPTGESASSYFNTLLDLTGLSNVFLQSMPVGSSQCVRVHAGHTEAVKPGNSQIDWRTTFQRKVGTVDLSGTSYGVVYRASQYKWTMEPSGGCHISIGNPDSIAKLVKVTSRNPPVDCGAYDAPFKLVLEDINAPQP